MATVVIDASALLEVLIGAEPDTRLRHRVGTSGLVAPEVITTEVLGVLRRRLRSGHLRPERAAWWMSCAPIATVGHRLWRTGSGT
ncbi:hypothetical protein [Saccharothrix yanglingensis]|uniref:PIN domain-containing protein n=1 Tax=Saccharothrix yanglingensis TaxID=659496 RepID=A0ABU0WZK9_9PSEU|nr:hypothetical protein [Saccharothrix yanglingensis]MDQ2585309.1 hypothetical protein [Saccharothrix yanglingensis]